MVAERLEDIADVTAGTSPKGELINSDGVGLPFFQGSKEFGELVPRAERYTEHPVRTAREGDVLVGVRAPVGKVNLSPFDCAIGRGVMAVTPKNQSDGKFLFYFLRYLEGKWDALGSTGSIFENLSASVLRSVEIPENLNRPKIGEVLYDLDLKIENNKLLARTLESTAQTIFRSWFIDFDPVKAKMAGEAPVGMDAETAALFPDSMKESKLGEVPFGWRVVGAGEIASTTIGGLWGADDSGDGRSSSYYCLRGTDLDDLKGAGLAERTPVRWDKAENIGKRQSANNHVLIGGSGAGPVGKSLLWDSSIDALFDSPVIYSNFVKRFETSTQAEATFLYFLLQEMLVSGEIFEYVGGTSVPNLLDKTLLQSKIFVIPPEPLLRVFDALYRAALQIRYSGQSRYLAQLRDALLPRLISGELQLPEEMLVA